MWCDGGPMNRLQVWDAYTAPLYGGPLAGRSSEALQAAFRILEWAVEPARRDEEFVR